MSEPYLEITFRRGKALAAYYYLQRRPGQKSFKTRRVEPGMVIDFNRGGEPIGGYFQLALGDTVYGAWGATLHEYLELRPVYLAYWTILADAAAQGYRFLDMGRSPAGSSASNYKGQWATQMTPIYQQTWTPRPGGSQDGAVSVAQQAQSDARFQMVRRVWPKLPFPVAQRLGPLLRRHVPFA